MHREVKAILGQAEGARHEIIRIANGVLFEVVPEGEVTEHFEKGMVTGAWADIFEVVVFSRNPHASLHARGPHIGAPILPQKHVLELHHSGISEQKGRVVSGNQRRRGDDRVAPLRKELKKRAPDFCALPVGGMGRWIGRSRAFPFLALGLWHSTSKRAGSIISFWESEINSITGVPGLASGSVRTRPCPGRD